MPYIFPKRFLRHKDILHPEEFQADVDGVTAALDQGLDRTNFFASSLKTLPAQETSGEPSVGSGAYYDIQYTGVEVRTRMEFDEKTETYPTYPSRNESYQNAHRAPPNFVQPDGKTFRDDGVGGALAGSLNRKPFVIPHTGEWTVVPNGQLSGPMQTTFETVGKAKVWITAYLQYVWQGFYEHKNPWVTYLNSDYKDVDEWGDGPHSRLDSDGNVLAWSHVDHPYRYDHMELAQKERDALNAFGPSHHWACHAAEYASDVIVQDVPYAFPLNEYKAQVEGSHPNFGGQHHISKGFYPALVQFALRVDGEIIDETITGKQFSYEESAHGMRFADGPIEKATVTIDDEEHVFYSKRSQRAGSRKASYGKQDSLSASGQKLRSSRAVAMGPECMPVRLGAVVPIEGGNHTVEIVARRLSRKKKDFGVGDFVGVFTRKITSITLPIFGDTYDPRSEEFNPELFRAVPNGSLGPFFDNQLDTIEPLRKRLNGIQPGDVKSHSLPNTHLPSKVLLSRSVSITTHKDSVTAPLQRTGSSAILDPSSHFNSTARFPGFMNSFQMDEIGGVHDDWYNEEGKGGWAYVSGDSGAMRMQPIGDESFSVGAKEHLLVFANIEFFRIEPLFSGKAAGAIPPAEGAHTEDIWKDQRDYQCWRMEHKYLDLFAYFAIGYKLSGKWYIGSQLAPALVNSFNWVNRTPRFVAEDGENLAYVHNWVEPGDPGHYGTGASEVSFKLLAKSEGVLDRRGGQTYPSNCGIDIPLFAHIPETSGTIEEIALFVSSTFPHNWDYRHARYGEEYSTAARAHISVDSDGDLIDTEYIFNDWASPQEGRGILRGTEVFWGDATLSILKLSE
tara:strand:+ start:4585 stop:7119 length:2535 start_codon:yes stop_codon:yes gene_type:complete